MSRARVERSRVCRTMRLVAFFSFFLTVERSPSSTLLFSSSSSPPSSSFENMVSFLPFTSRSKATADGGAAPLGTGGKPASPFSRFKQKAAEITSSSSSQPPHMLVPGAPLPHIVLPVVHVSFLWGPLWNACKGAERDTGGERRRVSKPSFFALSLSLSLFLVSLLFFRRTRVSDERRFFSFKSSSLFFFPLSHFVVLLSLPPRIEPGRPRGDRGRNGRVRPDRRRARARVPCLSQLRGGPGRALARPRGPGRRDRGRLRLGLAPGRGGLRRRRPRRRLDRRLRRRGGGSSVPGSPSSYPLDDLPFKLAYGLTPEMMKGEDLVLSTRKSRGRKEKKSVLQK